MKCLLALIALTLIYATSVAVGDLSKKTANWSVAPDVTEREVYEIIMRYAPNSVYPFTKLKFGTY
jgi:hypothetical protein